MATLAARITALAQAIGADIKAALRASPPPGGSTGQVLTKASAADYDTAWATPAGGSGPSGPVDVVHFNDVDTPAKPTSGLKLFARSQGGRMLPAFIGPSGIESNLQPALFRNTTYMWLPGFSTTVSINWGVSWLARNSGTGTGQTHPTKTSATPLGSLNRALFSTGSTATGASGIQSSLSVAWRGNAPGLGGFFFFARFGVEALKTGDQIFVGLGNFITALSGDPTAFTNTAALAKDAADSNWFFITRSGSGIATKTPTGLAVTAGEILDLMFFAPPNGSSITVRLVNSVTGQVYMDDVVITQTLPDPTVFMYAQCHIKSTAGTTPSQLSLNRMYIETDL